MASTFKIFQQGKEVSKNDCTIRIERIGGSCVDVRASIATTSKVNIFLNIIYTDGITANQEDTWVISVPKGTQNSYRTCYGMSGDNVEISSISLDSYTPMSDDTTNYKIVTV